MRPLILRAVLLHLLCITFFLSDASRIQAQTIPDRTERLFHVGRVWGYIKYFHPGASGCATIMDTVLLEAIRIVDTATDVASYERGLLTIFEKAGPMPPATTPPVQGDLFYAMNRDLGWHDDPALPASIQANLDSIRTNFRPFNNCYFNIGSNAYQFVLDENDYSPSVAVQPGYPLLLLFRAWNTHNYYSPYRRLIEPAWDSALLELIPYFDREDDVLDLHLAFLRYQAHQQDAHSSSASNLLNSHFGVNYLPCLFSSVEGKTVVSKVFAGVDGLRPGDVVLSIDGTPVNALRDSLRPYTQGGAPEIVDRNINRHLLRGVSQSAVLEVENTQGTRTIELQRSASLAEITDSAYHWRGDGQVWKVLPGNIGYVNVGILTKGLVQEMYEALRETNAIVFDSRNYPGEFVIYDVSNLILPSRRVFCNFYYPEPIDPGTFVDVDLFCGPASNPDNYKGDVRILQNEMTQSQAEFTIMAWQTHPNAKIIGSQTAGADGNVSTFQFPTALSLTYSGCGVLYPDRGETQIVGIEEDITVTPTIEGIRAGRDEVLEAALATLSVDRPFDETHLELSASIGTDGTLRLSASPELESGTMLLRDVLGRVVLTDRYDRSVIDVSKLAKGTYLVEINKNDLIARTRVQKCL